MLRRSVEVEVVALIGLIGVLDRVVEKCVGLVNGVNSEVFGLDDHKWEVLAHECELIVADIGTEP